MITSLTNEKMKEYAKLNQSKYREEKGLFIVEGPHLVSEAKQLNLLEEYPDTNDLVENVTLILFMILMIILLILDHIIVGLVCGVIGVGLYFLIRLKKR